MTVNIKHSYSSGDHSELHMLKQHEVYIWVKNFEPSIYSTNYFILLLVTLYSYQLVNISYVRDLKNGTDVIRVTF